MDGLTKLFGGPARMKILRLFLVNGSHSFSLSEIKERTQLSGDSARRTLSQLISIGLMKKQGTGKALKYVLNTKFPHLDALKALFMSTATVSHEGIGRLMRTCGRVKLLVLSGIFSNALEAGADILLVGDRMDEGKVEKGIRQIETSLGRELRYVLIGSDEFRYRTSVYDRLVRDILEYPKVVVIDTVGVTEN